MITPLYLNFIEIYIIASTSKTVFDGFQKKKNNSMINGINFVSNQILHGPRTVLLSAAAQEYLPIMPPQNAMTNQGPSSAKLAR